MAAGPIELAELEQYLAKAADLLRGAIDQAKSRGKVRMEGKDYHGA